MIGWAIVVVGVIATAWTFGAAILWTIRPGETEPDHPKRIVLRDDR